LDGSIVCVLCGERPASKRSLICGACALRVHYSTERRFRKLRELLDFIIENGEVRARDVMQKFGVSERTAYRMLDDLRHYRMVVRVAIDRFSFAFKPVAVIH